MAGPCSIRPPIARGPSTMRTSSCSRCRAERGGSCTAAAITAGICRAVTCCTSTTVCSSPCRLISTGYSQRGRRRPCSNGVTSNTHTGSAQFAVSTDGHARVHTRSEHRRGAAGRLDGSRREHYPVVGQPCELVQRSFRSRWTPDRGGTFFRTNVSTSGSTIRSRDMATPLNARPSKRIESGVDSGWPPHRVQLEPRQLAAQPVLAASRWDRQRATPDQEPSLAVARLLAPERQVPGV